MSGGKPCGRTDSRHGRERTRRRPQQTPRLHPRTSTSAHRLRSDMRRLSYLFPAFPVLHRRSLWGRSLGLKRRGYDIVLISLKRSQADLQQPEADRCSTRRSTVPACFRVLFWERSVRAMGPTAGRDAPVRRRRCGMAHARTRDIGRRWSAADHLELFGTCARRLSSQCLGVPR